MNREETIAIMAVLKAAYPGYYREMSRKDAEGIVALWQEMFADEPVQLVAAAVKALIATDAKGSPPHIGAVKAHIRKLTTPQEMTDGEAWALVSWAVRNMDWLAPEKQYNALPEDIRASIGSPHTLVEWGKMDEAVFASVASSNFRRTYRVRRAARKEYEALPNDIKAMAIGLATGRGLEDGT